MTARHGGCLCGQIRYVYDPVGVIWCTHCHCESCRRATGAPVTTYFAVRRSALRWLGAEPRPYASSPGVTRGFCPECGTSLTYDYHGKPAEVHLHAPTLDDPTEVTPTAHDFWEERLPWLRIDDELPRRTAADSRLNGAAPGRIPAGTKPESSDA